MASHSPPSELRVGSVPYLVGRPVDLDLGREEGIQLVHAPPADLVAELRAGRLDVALVSSIELFRQPGYGYIDGPLIAGRGEVGSVQLFLRRPLEEARTVALDPASRTARTLLRVLLAQRPGGGPELLEVEAGQDPRELDADGWLRIGDRALRETLEPASPHTYNPSEHWCQRVGLPFVFAAWIVRPGIQLGPHAAAFQRARARGAARAEELALEAAQAWDIAPEAARHYLLQECEYEVGDELLPALLAFRDAAAELGLCSRELIPTAHRLEGARVP